MKGLSVLHLTIGLPPLRSGGLVKYSVDLAESQSLSPRFGRVMIMIPGRQHILKQQVFITQRQMKRVSVFEVHNSTPVGLIQGTKYPEKEQFNPGLSSAILRTVRKLMPDVVHIHSLMGFSADLVDALADTRCRMVFTAHDYHPICPITSLLDYQNNVCLDTDSGRKCAVCNAKAWSRTKIMIRDSEAGRTLKQIPEIRERTLRKNRKVSRELIERTSQSFRDRRSSFLDSFRSLDIVHFCSDVTKRLYEINGFRGNHVIIPITSSSIRSDVTSFLIRVSLGPRKVFGYLGGDREEKGFRSLIEAFEKVSLNGLSEWKLLLGGKGSENIIVPSKIESRVSKLGFIKNLDEFFRRIDYLIVPSIWPETFGLVVLEAISRGVPVIASSLVGAAGSLPDDIRIVYDHGQLFNAILSILGRKDSSTVYEIQNTFAWRNHVREIGDLYLRLIKGSEI